VGTGAGGGRGPGGGGRRRRRTWREALVGRSKRGAFLAMGGLRGLERIRPIWRVRVELGISRTLDSEVGALRGVSRTPGASSRGHSFSPMASGVRDDAHHGCE